MVEPRGLEPLTEACKATMIPVSLGPRLFYGRGCWIRTNDLLRVKELRLPLRQSPIYLKMHLALHPGIEPGYN